jgi:CRP-like cAMP-binding protein
MKLNRKFRKLFSLTGQEALLHRLTLSLDVGRRHLHGRIFLGEEHVGIISRMFSIEHKVAFHWSEVDEVVDPDAPLSPGHSPRSSAGGDEQHRKITLRMQATLGLEDVTFLLPQTEKSVTHQQLMVLCQGLQHKHRRRVESPPRVNAPPVFGSNPPSAQSSRRGSRIKRPQGDRALHRTLSHPAITDKLTLTKWDWALLLEGATCREYQDGEVIVHEGQKSDSIFQIGSGVCRITKRGSLIGMLANLEMFGEVSFLHPSGVSPYTVEAAGDGVQVYSMSRAWLDEQFVLDEHARLITLAGKHAVQAGSVSTGLAGRFYKFLALTVARRIRQRELETVLSGPSEVDLGGSEKVVSLTHLSEMTR